MTFDVFEEQNVEEPFNETETVAFNWLQAKAYIPTDTPEFLRFIAEETNPEMLTLGWYNQPPQISYESVISAMVRNPYLPLSIVEEWLTAPPIVVEKKHREVMLGSLKSPNLNLTSGNTWARTLGRVGILLVHNLDERTAEVVLEKAKEWKRAPHAKYYYLESRANEVTQKVFSSERTPPNILMQYTKHVGGKKGVLANPALPHEVAAKLLRGAIPEDVKPLLLKKTHFSFENAEKLVSLFSDANLKSAIETERTDSHFSEVCGKAIAERYVTQVETLSRSGYEISNLTLLAENLTLLARVLHERMVKAVNGEFGDDIAERHLPVLVSGLENLSERYSAFDLLGSPGSFSPLTKVLAATVYTLTSAGVAKEQNSVSRFKGNFTDLTVRVYELCSLHHDFTKSERVTPVFPRSDLIRMIAATLRSSVFLDQERKKELDMCHEWWRYAKTVDRKTVFPVRH